MAVFENWLKTSRFNYKTAEQKQVDLLQKGIQNSGDFDKIKGNLSEIKKVVDAQANAQLKKDISQIKEELELEILGRYYYQKAMKFVSFEKDEDIQEALRLFKNPEKYKSILAGK